MVFDRLRENVVCSHVNFKSPIISVGFYLRYSMLLVRKKTPRKLLGDPKSVNVKPDIKVHFTSELSICQNSLTDICSNTSNLSCSGSLENGASTLHHYKLHPTLLNILINVFSSILGYIRHICYTLTNQWYQITNNEEVFYIKKTKHFFPHAEHLWAVP